jgi:hypothetical protein
MELRGDSTIRASELCEGDFSRRRLQSCDEPEDVMSMGAEEKELVNNGAELAGAAPSREGRTDPYPLVSGGRGPEGWAPG